LDADTITTDEAEELNAKKGKKDDKSGSDGKDKLQEEKLKPKKNLKPIL